MHLLHYNAQEYVHHSEPAINIVSQCFFVQIKLTKSEHLPWLHSHHLLFNLLIYPEHSQCKTIFVKDNPCDIC